MVPASLRNCAGCTHHRNTPSNNKSGFGKSGVHRSLMGQELQVASQGGPGLHRHRRPRQASLSFFCSSLHMASCLKVASWFNLLPEPPPSHLCSGSRKKATRRTGGAFPRRVSYFQGAPPKLCPALLLTSPLPDLRYLAVYTAARNIGKWGPERISGSARMVKAQKPGMGEPCGASLPPNPAESEDRGQDEPHRVPAKDTDQCQLLPAGLGRDSCPLPGCPKAPPPQL